MRLVQKIGQATPIATKQQTRLFGRFVPLVAVDTRPPSSLHCQRRHL